MAISKNFCRLFIPGFLIASPTVLFGNPTGATVAGGAATISGQGTANLSVHQTSNAAIINWQSFSVNAGETTQFFMPSVQSAALNRVLGGGVSSINGQLLANGRLYLINQNGIVVGPNGLINAASFTGSTRDIANSDFLKGKLHFVGHNNGSVVNQGIINAGLGDVTLIGKTVDNQGTLNALRGTAALVAGDDVLLAQKNADGSSVVVNTSPLATAVSSTSVGVSNSGTINATSAELKAAGGNIYALAINNSGTIRASTLKKQGGHIWLTAKGGSLVNGGTLNASATVAKGTGGRVILKNTGGTTTNSGQIIATGGVGGTGGYVDISGSALHLNGSVNLSAQGGTPGTFFIDPSTLMVVSDTGIGALVSGSGYYENGAESTSISASYVETGLAKENVMLNADTNITIGAEISWITTSKVDTTLTLSTNNEGSTLDIEAPIMGNGLGSLTIDLANTGDKITTATGAAGAIAVNSFVLQNGDWTQVGNLAPFSSTDFEVRNSSTFLRALGGNGSAANPYLITDVYGLQGIGANSLLGDSFALANDIDASSTKTWNSSAGFNAIGSSSDYPFRGSFNGQGHTISALFESSYSAYYQGVFGFTTGSITNLNLAGNCSFSGYNAGSVAGINEGTISNCTSSALVNGIVGDEDARYTGGLVGRNFGTVTNSSFGGTLSGSSYYAGGIVGINSGTISRSISTGSLVMNSGNALGGVAGSNSGNITQSYNTGSVSGFNEVGGVVGINSGQISQSYSTGAVSVTPNAKPTFTSQIKPDASFGSSGTAGGLVGENQEGGTITDTYSTGYVGSSGSAYALGGLVGQNYGSITTSYSAGGVSSNSSYRGGIAGGNSGSITNTYWLDPPATTGIGNPASNNGATPEPLSALQTQSTFQPAGTGTGNWNFTQGGIWGIIQGVNDNLPVFQWQYGYTPAPTATPTTPTIPYPLPINTPLPVYPNVLSQLGVDSYIPEDTGDYNPGDPITYEQDQGTEVTSDSGPTQLSVKNSITGIINDNGAVGFDQFLILPGQYFGIHGGPAPLYAQQALDNILDNRDGLQAALGGGDFPEQLIRPGGYYTFSHGTPSPEEVAELGRILGQRVLDALLVAIKEHREEFLILPGHYYVFHGESVPDSIRAQLDFMLSPGVRNFLEKAEVGNH